MPAILDTNQIGKREDLADIIWLAAVTETPFLSSARKGKRLDRVDLYQYQVKKLGDRKSGGVPDGKDIDAFDANPPRALLYGRGEVFRRAPMVGFIAEGNIVAGITDEFADAVADQMIEHKKDMEKECYSDQDSQPDDGVNGSKFRGLGRWINDGTTPGFGTELPPPTAFRTPTAQIFSGSIGDGITTGLTEATFTAMAQNRWDSIGQSSELQLYCGVNIKNRVGLYSRYSPNITGATPVVRTSTAEYNGGEFYGQSVDIFNTDWGTFTLMPVNTEFLPDAYRAYGLDMKQIEIRPRYMMKEQDLPNLMGGPREGIESIISPVIGDPRSHIKIVGSA
jgi:Family of unknown function (DUF5309)